MCSGDAQATSAEQKRRWCTQLKLLVVEHFSARLPARAKQLLLADLLGTGSPSPASSCVVTSNLSDVHRPSVPAATTRSDADALVSNGFATVSRRPKPSKSKSLASAPHSGAVPRRLAPPFTLSFLPLPSDSDAN